MKKYITPEVEIVDLMNDIITTSGTIYPDVDTGAGGDYETPII